MSYNELMEITGRKLSQPQRMQVFALMARGDTAKQINDFLEKQHGLTLNASSISEMRTKHKDTIEEMRATIQQNELVEVESLMQKSRRLLNRKLDRADRDMSELEQLDEDYRNGSVDSVEYKRKKATLMNVSITEIAMVSKNLHEQSKKSDDPNNPALPAGNPLQTEALLKAIKQGDTVELQRIILNPQGQLSHPV